MVWLPGIDDKLESVILIMGFGLDKRLPDPASDEFRQLKEENARLKELLRRQGIDWDAKGDPPARLGKIREAAGVPFSPAEKISLFRRLFRGRTDVYARRWESLRGKSGYSPVCGDEWKPGVCRKPQVKCADCACRRLLPLDDQVIYDHLAGKHTAGLYPLLTDDTCGFLAVDFDGAEWEKDAAAFRKSCRELEIPAALEISRSGNGAHIWIFFSQPVPAAQARQLGSALISHTCERTRQLSLTSYDRFFPNQDTLPRGGFGNLIALPLQKLPRLQGRSVFAGDNFAPYPDQWAFLTSIRPLSGLELAEALLRAGGGRHPLDLTADPGEDEPDPWQRPIALPRRIPGPLPESLRLVLGNQIYIAKADLPQPLLNRLIRLAAFPNPEFYRAQAMRMPVWNKPRVIGCAENFPRHIGLPRGCRKAVLELLEQNVIRFEIEDTRPPERKVEVKFIGTLRREQKAAVRAILQEETGVLCAPPGFGKTVVAAAVISRRRVSTLILVHRTELLRQWRERLSAFLELPKGSPGAIGGGRKKSTGEIDVAILQSLSRRPDLEGLLDNYSQIIVDECHHISAVSFEAVIRASRARYILGLTATPVRRDGHHPIVLMQCGPIRHQAAGRDTAPAILEVIPAYLPPPQISPETPIQEVFRAIAADENRARRICRDVIAAYREGRKILVLTERTGHLELLRAALEGEVKNCFVLHGRLGKRQRQNILGELAALDNSAPRALLATGRLIGEGFDHPPLDTLVLAMPISWKGTLRQYAGRLHREHPGKRDAHIYDYIDSGLPRLLRMWMKRRRGYRAMGYRIRAENDGQTGLPGL